MNELEQIMHSIDTAYSQLRRLYDELPEAQSAGENGQDAFLYRLLSRLHAARYEYTDFLDSAADENGQYTHYVRKIVPLIEQRRTRRPVMPLPEE